MIFKKGPKSYSTFGAYFQKLNKISFYVLVYFMLLHNDSNSVGIFFII